MIVERDWMQSLCIYYILYLSGKFEEFRNFEFD
jgi:hypothetical protein